jgi:hypothetical protein
MYSTKGLIMFEINKETIGYVTKVLNGVLGKDDQLEQEADRYLNWVNNSKCDKMLRAIYAYTQYYYNRRTLRSIGIDLGVSTERARNLRLLAEDTIIYEANKLIRHSLEKWRYHMVDGYAVNYIRSSDVESDGSFHVLLGRASDLHLRGDIPYENISLGRYLQLNLSRTLVFGELLTEERKRSILMEKNASMATYANSPPVIDLKNVAFQIKSIEIAGYYDLKSMVFATIIPNGPHEKFIINTIRSLSYPHHRHTNHLMPLVFALRYNDAWVTPSTVRDGEFVQTDGGAGLFTWDIVPDFDPLK